MIAMNWTEYLILFAVTAGAYLIGSLSPAVFITRTFGGFDVRQVGSGNAGSTNVLRSMGWKFGLLNFAVDTAKGAVPVLLAMLLPEALRPWGMALAGVGAILGHVWPVLHHFKGGKAVATTFGALLVLEPLFALALLALFLVIVLVSGYISLGSILGISAGAVASFFIPEFGPQTIMFMVVSALMICFSHRGNIARLIHGEETKFDLKKIPGGNGKAKKEKHGMQ